MKPHLALRPTVAAMPTINSVVASGWPNASTASAFRTAANGIDSNAYRGAYVHPMIAGRIPAITSAESSETP